MASVYSARLNNAKKIYSKLKDYLDKGYMIWDDENEIVTCIEWTDTDFIYNECLALFVFDRELDNGYYTPISKFNERFKSWKIVNPKNIKRLVK